jgi:hypothetical protein
MRRIWWIILGIAVIGAGAFLLWPRGVKVVVANTGTTAMRDVRVAVTGNSYRLGDLRPGERRGVHVKPTGDSSITLQYTDEGGGGDPQSVDLDCYIEAGYAGSVSVDMANGVVVRKADATRPSPW